MPPRPLTHAEQAVLSLVAEAPCHGYQIEQLIRQRDMRAWADLGFSSIYYLLGRLERGGMVRSTRRASPEGPSRRVYRCTPSGAAALRRAVRQALTEPKPGDSPIQLALANLPVLSPGERLRALTSYVSHLRQVQGQLHRRRAEQPHLPDHVAEMFARSQALLRTELRWAESFRRRMTHSPARTPSIRQRRTP